MAEMPAPLARRGEERGDPIPPGIYWLDVVGADFAQYLARLQAFSRWYREHAARVKVLREDDGARQMGVEHHSRWILFEVLDAVPRWPVEARLGFPNVAPNGSLTREPETVRAPAPEPFSWPDLGGMFGGGLGLLVILYLLTKGK